MTTDLLPETDDRVWVFCSVDPAFDYAPLDPIAVFVEREAVTLVVERHVAVRHELGFTFPSRRITFGAYTDLASVGILAGATTKLAAHGISTNAFCAYYHDHVFVPEDRADEAMRILLDE
jgi:hypothetical protein